MSGIFEKYVILTDLDGTVFDGQLNLLEKDIEAIKYFTANGGTYGVSTGRTMVSANPLIGRLPTNAPCIYNNGGVIIDPKTNDVKYCNYIHPDARKALKEIMNRFPNLRAAVLMGDHFYNVTEFNDGERPFCLDVPETIAADIDKIPDGWYKVLMNIMDHSMEEIEAFCKTLDYPEIAFMVTTSYYYEVLPKENSKARGNRKLMEVMGWQDKTLVAIGDFYNDLEMILTADIGVAVANAPEDIKAQADIVVCSVLEGATAELISRLEKM